MHTKSPAYAVVVCVTVLLGCEPPSHSHAALHQEVEIPAARPTVARVVSSDATVEGSDAGAPKADVAPSGAAESVFLSVAAEELDALVRHAETAVKSSTLADAQREVQKVIVGLESLMIPGKFWNDQGATTFPQQVQQAATASRAALAAKTLAAARERALAALQKLSLLRALVDARDFGMLGLMNDGLVSEDSGNSGRK